MSKSKEDPLKEKRKEKAIHTIMVVHIRATEQALRGQGWDMNSETIT